MRFNFICSSKMLLNLIGAVGLYPYCHPASAMIFTAVFCVRPNELMDTLSGVNDPNALSSFDDPSPFNGYSNVGPESAELPFGEARYSISSTASALFVADRATPAALMLTWAGFGMTNLTFWVKA